MNASGQTDSVLTIHNKRAQYHLLLPRYTPDKVVTFIWRAVEAEGNPLVNDMGILSMIMIEMARKIPGARLIGDHMLKVSRTVRQVFSIDRPERSLKFTMHDVVLEKDVAPQPIEVYRGAFSDFKKYLPAIVANRGVK